MCSLEVEEEPEEEEEPAEEEEEPAEDDGEEIEDEVDDEEVLDDGEGDKVVRESALKFQQQVLRFDAPLRFPGRSRQRKSNCEATWRALGTVKPGD